MSKFVNIEDWRQERDREVIQKIEDKKRKSFKRPLTENHLHYMQLIAEKSVVACVGPAGTGKTSLACQVASKLICSGTIQNIVITRPLVECGGKLGFLPGGVEDKMSFFIAAVVKALKRDMGSDQYERLKKEEKILVIPLEQMRGETFDDAVVIVDEPQNATYEQLHMALTRLGDNCHIVLCGDLKQSDLVRAKNNLDAVPLMKVIRSLSKMKEPDIGICVMTHQDVLRPPLVAKIDKALCETEKEEVSSPSYYRRRV
jgi:phosphate starvation-inducible PhoH-like protein